MTEPSFTVHIRSGSFEEALANGQRLLDRDPSAALKQAETLVRMGKDARVYKLAAAACRKLGLKADAEGAELGAIEASLEIPLLKQAATAFAEGEAIEARRIAEQFLQSWPGDLLAMTIAAEASIELWDLDHAEQLLRSILERAPAFLRASLLLTSCLANQVRMREAMAVLGEVVARKPNNATALAQLGQMSAEVNDNEQAALIFERLAALNETQVARWTQLAHHYRIVGRRDEAIAAFRRALALDPSSGAAWWSFANYFPKELSGSDEDAIRTSMVDKAGTADEGALHLALGILADRNGDRAKAAEHFIAGKKIRLEHQPYDPGPISVAVDGVIDILSPQFYDHRKQAGWPDASPIFIIGMPRSGTTMVERMLGRHSAIEGAGEMHIMPKLAERARHEADNPENYAGLLESLSDEQLGVIGRRYVEASWDYRRSSKPLFIDKNNLNWMQIGLILLALPKAKVIDVRRNALDCCWANFKMLFAERFPATNDLRHVGQFYRDYVRLFDAMKQAAPERILSVCYEDVVDDIEGQTRRMLDSLGLEYEPDCINFHLGTEAVATASSEQVRQPLNRKGIGSAEPYWQWLGPLIEELGPLAGEATATTFAGG
jgi:tetratricopeptide (TPR) repeat protein